MLIDVFEASKTFPLAVGRLELQRDVNDSFSSTLLSRLPQISVNGGYVLTWQQKFDEWREIWTTDDGEVDIGFEAYAKSNPVFAKRVLRQLALMSQVLFDARGLEEFYGIKSDRSNRVSPIHFFNNRTQVLVFVGQSSFQCFVSLLSLFLILKICIGVSEARKCCYYSNLSSIFWVRNYDGKVHWQVHRVVLGISKPPMAWKVSLSTNQHNSQHRNPKTFPNSDLNPALN